MTTMLARNSDSFVFVDVEEPDAANMAAKSIDPFEITHQTSSTGSDLPELAGAHGDGATEGDVKPVVGPDGTLLLCRESTGECIEWPSG